MSDDEHKRAARARRLVEWVAKHQGAEGLFAALCDPAPCIVANNARRAAIFFGTAQEIDTDAADDVRAQAAIKLRELKDERIIEQLIGALRHRNRMVRLYASELVAHLHVVQAVPALTLLLSTDSIEEVRQGALAALLAIEAPDKAQLIATELRKRASSQCLWSIEALSAGMPSTNSMSPSDIAIIAQVITPMLSAKDWAARCRVVSTLERIHWQPSTVQDRVCWALMRKDWKTLIELGDTAIELLIEQSRVKPDKDVGTRIEDGLRSFGPTAVEPLIAASTQEDAVARRAIRVLGTIEDPRVLSALAALIADARWPTNVCAIQALAKLEDDRVVDILIDTLAHSLRDVRQHAADALAQLHNPRIAERLTHMLLTGEATFPHIVVYVLSKLGDPRTVEPLIALAHQRDWRRDGEDEQMKWVCAVGRALAGFKDPRVDGFLESAMELPDRLIVLGALKYYGACCKPDWETVIMETVDRFGKSDLVSRTEIVDALSRSTSERLRRYSIKWHEDIAML